MSERLPCNTNGCTRTILPSTAAETGGFCHPCLQEQRRKAHQEWVLQNRREVDPFAGLTAPFDIIRVMHEDRPYNELITYVPLRRSVASVYAELSPLDIDRLIDLVVELAGPGHHSHREQLLLELAAYTSADLDRALLALTVHSEYHPGMAFRRAGPKVRAALLAATEEQCELALHALAWVDHPQARDRFRQWRQIPPTYQSLLHVQASDYARIGGWQVEADGSLRRLHLDTCWALVPPTAIQRGSQACRIGVPTDQPCPQCGRALTDLLIMDRQDQRLAAIPWPKRHIHVRTCLTDTCIGPVFMGHSGTHPKWIGDVSPRKAPDKGDWSAVPEGSLILDDRPRNLLHGASDCLPDPLSQVGGLPAWIQDDDYLQCPSCASAMLCVAQVSVADVHERGEGMYYALICPSCQVTGTTYQQT